MTLFLGGPWHGEHHDFGEKPRLLVVPIPTNPFLSDSEMDTPLSGAYKTFEYELRKLGFGRTSQTVAVYAPKGDSEGSIDWLLIRFLEGR